MLYALLRYSMSKVKQASSCLVLEWNQQLGKVWPGVWTDEWGRLFCLCFVPVTTRKVNRPWLVEVQLRVIINNGKCLLHPTCTKSLLFSKVTTVEVFEIQYVFMCCTSAAFRTSLTHTYIHLPTITLSLQAFIPLPVSHCTRRAVRAVSEASSQLKHRGSPGVKVKL